ncbi:unnamed protein product, partial [Prorocentrum cordatum]
AAGTGQRCARCGHAHASFTFFCESCGGVMQGEHGAVTHFELLGVPARFDLDLAAADSAFKELQKRLHPDRHAQATAAERELVEVHSARLNEAMGV